MEKVQIRRRRCRDMIKYIQFISDSTYYNDFIIFKGKPSQDQIRELQLEEYLGYYRSTLDKVSAAGWELAFVSPTGMLANQTDGRSGELVSLLVFRKF